MSHRCPDKGHARKHPAVHGNAYIHARTCVHEHMHVPYKQCKHGQQAQGGAANNTATIAGMHVVLLVYLYVLAPRKVHPGLMANASYQRRIEMLGDGECKSDASNSDSYRVCVDAGRSEESEIRYYRKSRSEGVAGFPIVIR
jgi:hypothetical protein